MRNSSWTERRYVNLPTFVREPLREYYESGGSDPRKWRWSWTVVTLKKLASEVWKHLPNMRKDFKSFAAYHRWYVRGYSKPEWAKKSPDSIWAIMLDGPPGGPYDEDVIEDGWHRFHYYIDRHGMNAKVPVVWPASRIR